LFEVGVVFSHPDEGSPRLVERSGTGGARTALLPGERELLGAVFAYDDDDARSAVAAWHVLADAFRVSGVRLVAAGTEPLPGLHPTRSARLVVHSNGRVIGAVGEIDPDVAVQFGLTQTSGAGTSARRIGWIEVDLALVVDDAVPADLVADALGAAAGDLIESVSLFDVYRGTGIGAGARSLAFRLRFCSLDHTLTDDEVGALRTRCIDAVVSQFGAALR
jgi:phenylalanyl-tRNA synthetase beta chain